MTLGDAFEAAVREAVTKVIREVLAEQIRQPLPDELLNLKHAAEVADVSVATVRRWIQRGFLKRYGTPRLPRVRRADVLAVRHEVAALKTPDEIAAQLLARRR